jgi:hypothetical protein
MASNRRSVTPIVKKRRPKRGVRERDLDSMFSRIIRSRGSCELCGSIDRIQCAHLVSRAYRAVRWDEDNAWCLCASCHTRYTHRPVEWALLLEERLGLEQVQALRRRALEYGKPDYRKIAERLRSRLEASQAV